MKNKIYILTLLFLPFTGFAQTDTTKSGSTVIFYSSSPSQKASAPIQYNSNAIKFGIVDIFSGLYGLHYERELGPLFSIQAGLGLTGRNFAAGVFGEEFEDNYFITPLYKQENQYDISDRHHDYTSRTAKMGFFLSLHPKFYYGEDGFEGSYIGIIVSHRKYNFEAFDVINDNSTFQSSEPVFNPSKVMKENEKNLILALSWGMQSLGDKVALDYNVAMGMKKISGERRDIGQTRATNSSDYIMVAALNEVSKTNFYFEISLKLGIHWAGGSSSSGI